MISLFVRMVIALIIIAPLVWLVTMLVAKKAAMSGSKKSMRVVEAVALGANKKIVLVEVAGRLLVLGVSQRDIRLLTELAHQQWAAQQEDVGEGRVREEASD